MDAQQVAERIREDALRRRERLLPLPTNIQAAADVALLESSPDVYHVELGSPRRLLGTLALFAKRTVRRLLAPALGRQVTFNEAVARVSRHFEEEIEALAERQDALGEMLAAQADELRALRAALEDAIRERS